VNGPDEVWAEQAGRLVRTEITFREEDSLRRYVRRLLSHRGRKLDLRSPFADATMEDGSRIHVAGPPVARKGICVSIRKFRSKAWRLEDLTQSQAIPGAAGAHLRRAVVEKKNILVCGGTGAGKTTLLGALIGEASTGERIVALEDIAEIQAAHPHFLSLEARPANQEGEGAVTLRSLLKEALRMRPDRLVIGECRGAEALDLLLALNSGHGGSMATIHASSARGALQRLEILALLGAQNVDLRAIQFLVASSIHYVVHVERCEGMRRVSSICEVKGLDGGRYLLKDLMT
jgi:pilus assembly protein CpaF